MKSKEKLIRTIKSRSRWSGADYAVYLYDGVSDAYPIGKKLGYFKAGTIRSGGLSLEDTPRDVYIIPTKGIVLSNPTPREVADEVPDYYRKAMVLLEWLAPAAIQFHKEERARQRAEAEARLDKQKTEQAAAELERLGAAQRYLEIKVKAQRQAVVDEALAEVVDLDKLAVARARYRRAVKLDESLKAALLASDRTQVTNVVRRALDQQRDDETSRLIDSIEKPAVKVLNPSPRPTFEDTLKVIEHSI